MIVVEIKTSIEALINWLAGTQKKLTDLSVPLKQSGMIMMRSIDTNFRAEGRPKWKPLAPSTIRQRRKGSATILQDTGTLKNSFSLEVRGNEEVAIGTSLIYAPTHNFGRVTSKATKKGFSTTVIPQRKFMLFQEEDIKRIDKVFLEFMGKQLTEKIVNIGGR
jgi:phage gpG-like protein